jgi:hypothetical protein
MIRSAITTVVLKDGQTTAKFRSREGVKGFYEKIVEWIGTGELDELIKKHRASIPPMTDLVSWMI